MTPEQTKRRAAVMQKHGEPGWRIEVKTDLGWQIGNPDWEAYLVYRAVRVKATEGKRVPLPWSVIELNMQVRWCSAVEYLVTVLRVSEASLGSGKPITQNDFTNMEFRGPNGGWKPLWTEEAGGEKIVEIISEEEEEV